MPNSLLDLLVHARQRPSMHVQDFSLAQLEAICGGYEAALYHHGVNEFGTQFNARFREYLWMSKGWSTSAGWAYAIRQHTAGSDESAWHRFFELLDEYRRTPFLDKPDSGSRAGG